MTPRTRPLLALLAFGLAASTAHAAWPEKPIRFIVPSAAGGSPDVLMRVMTNEMSKSMGVAIVVDNKPGASFTIGTAEIARAAPDGYTMGYGNIVSLAVVQTLLERVPYDVEKDLTLVSNTVRVFNLLAVTNSLPVKTVPELIAYAKKNPGKLSYGTPGSGSSMHFAGESLKAIAGIFIVHIPYRGAGPAVADLLGGQVPMGIAGLPPVVAPHKTGKIRIVAVTSTKRSGALPDVPAMAELPGFADYNFTNWTGIFMAAKTPPAVIERLAAEVGKAVQDPSVKEKLIAAGVDPLGLTTPEFVKFLAREKATYSKVAKTRNIKADD
jgi:tripartite-type tricarboxylate transporter receptor subunit TctC